MAWLMSPFSDWAKKRMLKLIVRTNTSSTRELHVKEICLAILAQVKHQLLILMVKLQMGYKQPLLNEIYE